MFAFLTIFYLYISLYYWLKSNHFTLMLSLHLIIFSFSLSLQSGSLKRVPSSTSHRDLASFSAADRDVNLMRERASKNQSFIYVKIPEVQVYFSYKVHFFSNFFFFTKIIFFMHLIGGVFIERFELQRCSRQRDIRDKE